MPQLCDATPTRGERLLTATLLSISILGTLVILHVAVDPQFFLKDDTVSYFLPQIKVQGDTLFTFRQIPQINLYQLLGHPLLQQGQCGVFYPLHYIFYLAAGKNIELAVPLEVGFHMLLAGLGMLALLRYLKVPTLVGFIGAYAYAFNGFLIDMGRNWMPVSGYMAWIPIIFLCAIRSAETNRGWLRLTLANVILFTLGHTDLFVRIIVAETLLFLVVAGSIRAVIRYLLTYVAAAALVMPILLPMIRGFILSTRVTTMGSFDVSVKASSALRAMLTLQNAAYVSVRASSALRALVTPPSSVSIFSAQSNTLALFNIMPLALVLFLGVVGARHLPGFLSRHRITTGLEGVERLIRPTLLQVSRSKYILLGISTSLFALPGALLMVREKDGDLISSLAIHALLMIGVYWTFKKGRPSARSPVLWATFTLLAISLSLGPAALTTYIFYPFVVFFRWSIKWYLVVQPCLTITCALVLSQLNYKWNLRVAAPLTMALMAICIWIDGTRAADFNAGFVPVSRTRNDKTAAMISGRLVSLGGNGIGSSTRLFADNIGSYYDVLSFSGYDPMISAEKLSLIRLPHVSIILDPGFYRANRPVLNAYGVQTYLGAHTEKYDFLGSPEFERVGYVDDVQIYRNRDADPIFFVSGSKESLPYHLGGNSVIVDAGDCADSREVVVGFLYDEGWKAWADGREISLTRDSYKRIVATLQPNTHSLTLTYCDPFFRYGVGLSLALSVLILGGYYGVARRRYQANA
jgi:hypothetical protein